MGSKVIIIHHSESRLKSAAQGASLHPGRTITMVRPANYDLRALVKGAWKAALNLAAFASAQNFIITKQVWAQQIDAAAVKSAQQENGSKTTCNRQ
jgi:hypothetical protein